MDFDDLFKVPIAVKSLADLQLLGKVTSADLGGSVTEGAQPPVILSRSDIFSPSGKQIWIDPKDSPAGGRHRAVWDANMGRRLHQFQIDHVYSTVKDAVPGGYNYVRLQQIPQGANASGGAHEKHGRGNFLTNHGDPIVYAGVLQLTKLFGFKFGNMKNDWAGYQQLQDLTDAIATRDGWSSDTYDLEGARRIIDRFKDCDWKAAAYFSLLIDEVETKMILSDAREESFDPSEVVSHY